MSDQRCDERAETEVDLRAADAAGLTMRHACCDAIRARIPAEMVIAPVGERA